MIPKKLKIAIEFLTIFRLGKPKGEIQTDDIADSIMFFPLVGIFLGGICGLTEFLLKYAIASNSVRSLFPVIILTVLTRGLHLDGVADCFDALHFAGYNKEKALDIMKGKTIGAFGASAIIIVIVGKILSISALPEELRIQSLILIPSLSRWTSAVVAKFGSPASGEGLGYTFTVYSTRKAFFISGLSVFLFSLLLLGLNGLVTFVTVSIFSAFLLISFNRAFGGVTGDVFGAVIEISEVFGFLLIGVIIR
ncbi:MAG: adenosylcobinamide-GDP ribazoletransferase [Candidatus Dadabacteria bacterium]